MSFSERKGDLFEAEDLDAIAHGVNCRGVMGAGFAKLIAQRYPKVLEEYREECRQAGHQAMLVGDCQCVETEDGNYVFNLATQDKPGPTAKLRYVAGSVALMLENCETYLAPLNIRRIGMPRIGCGIGNLDWIEVRMIIETLANESPIEVVVFNL